MKELVLTDFMSGLSDHMHALTHKEKLDEEEEERRRRLLRQAVAGGGGVRGGGGGRSARPSRHLSPLRQKPHVEERSLTERLAAIASGSQPTVIKVASYGGGGRLSAVMNYISREGAISAETETGERLDNRDDFERIKDEWAETFSGREDSRDIGLFKAEFPAPSLVSEDEAHALVRSSLAKSFGDRRYVYTVSQSTPGRLDVAGVLVLRDSAGERMTADAKAAEIAQSRFDQASGGGQGNAKIRFEGYGNGVEFGTAKIRSIVDAHPGNVRDNDGNIIADADAAGKLVQQNWRWYMHSRKGREVMHLIISARAGTDPDAFAAAAREFLADQFAGHKYVFTAHDPFHDPKSEGEGGKRPHIHVHAIIAMKDAEGTRLRTSPAVFKEWRAVMASRARDHGIAMEMSDRREFATAPAYTRNQVRAVHVLGRTEHVGTSPAAQSRYDAKRTGALSLATSYRSVEYAKLAIQAWEAIAEGSFNDEVRDIAKNYIKTINSTRSQEKLNAGIDRYSENNSLEEVSYMVTLKDAIQEVHSMVDVSEEGLADQKMKVAAAFKAAEQQLPDESKSILDGLRSAVDIHFGKVETLVGLKSQLERPLQIQRDTTTEIAASADTRPETAFPADFEKRFYMASAANKTHVYADSKGTRELFQAEENRLRAKTFDERGVSLMLDTAAHRGWTTIAVNGSKEFRREAWLEGQARGIAVTGYQPTEMDFQEVARREQTFLTNEIRLIEGRTSTQIKHPTAVEAVRAPEAQTQDKVEAALNLVAGVEGVLVSSGKKPFQNNPENEKSPYVVLETTDGEKTLWGVGLPDALAKIDAIVGDKISLREAGMEKVEKTIVAVVDGKKERQVALVDRRAWDAQLIERSQVKELAKTADVKVAENKAASAEQTAKPKDASGKRNAEQKPTKPEQQQRRIDQLKRPTRDDRER